MNSLLQTTDLVGNLIEFNNIYINENYNNKGEYSGVLNTKYGNNFYTHQSIELFRELII